MRTIFRLGAAGIMAGGLLFSESALAGGPCASVDQTLTKQGKSNYAALIAKSLKGKVKPAQVEVDASLKSGTWLVIYASTPIADPGYFFFDSSSGAPVFVDVWGGIADDGDGPVLTKWAQRLGANKEISACFAHVVMAD